LIDADVADANRTMRSPDRFQLHALGRLVPGAAAVVVNLDRAPGAGAWLSAPAIIRTHHPDAGIVEGERFRATPREIAEADAFASRARGAGQFEAAGLSRFELRVRLSHPSGERKTLASSVRAGLARISPRAVVGLGREGVQPHFAEPSIGVGLDRI